MKKIYYKREGEKGGKGRGEWEDKRGREEEGKGERRIVKKHEERK